MTDPEKLVLIPPAFEHDDCLIVGSAESLRALASACLVAAETGTIYTMTPYPHPGDGEYYPVRICPLQGGDPPLHPWYGDHPSINRRAAERRGVEILRLRGGTPGAPTGIPRDGEV